MGGSLTPTPQLVSNTWVRETNERPHSEGSPAAVYFDESAAASREKDVNDGDDDTRERHSEARAERVKQPTHGEIP